MENKRKIISDIYTVYRKFGIKSVSLSDLAHELSLSKGKISELVGDKENIIEAVITQFITDVKLIIDESRKKGKDVLDKLLMSHAGFIHYLSAINPGFFYHLRRYYPEKYAAIIDYRDNDYQKIIGGILLEGIEKSVFRSDVPVKFLLADQQNYFDFYVNEQYGEKFHGTISPKLFFLLMVNNIRGMTTLKGHQLLNEKYKNFQALGF